MQARTLKIIAALLIIGAIIMGMIGYKISQQDASQPGSAATAPQADASSFTYAQKTIISNQDLTKGSVINAEQVDLVPYPQSIEGGFSKVTDIVGKTLQTDLRKGDVLRLVHFEKRSLLADDVNPGYRAIAVKVDEVVGTGGFLQPGDYVDVIYTTRPNKESYNKSLARRVLSNVRLLAYGNDIGEAIPQITDEKGKPKTADKDSGKRSRSAVLEVAIEQINTLVLAENSGNIRLVAMGESDVQLAKFNTEDDRKPAKDEPTLMRSVTGLKPPPAPKSVYVYSGDSVETIRVPK